jgi:hypothetical protein
MDRGYLSPRHYFAMFAAVFIFLACVALFIAIVQGDASKGLLTEVGWAGLAAPFVLIFFVLWAGARKASQPVNYPRIEHLRIAGKYIPTSAAKIGVSPLHLR